MIEVEFYDCMETSCGSKSERHRAAPVHGVVGSTRESFSRLPAGIPRNAA